MKITQRLAVTPLHPSLDTHKLSGELDGFWSFSINYRYRIIFEFIPDGSVRFHAVGGHEVYK
ncbi:type II toxin-antitoxin system RelE/ParE family toxin [bacterium]|nr:MAG: type II toxin-antitoxin system RelE/ParE family toxin [bacterium]